MSESISLNCSDLLCRVANWGRNAALSRKGSRIKGRFLQTLAQGWGRNRMSKALWGISRTDVVSFTLTFNQLLYKSDFNWGNRSSWKYALIFIVRRWLFRRWDLAWQAQNPQGRLELLSVSYSFCPQEEFLLQGSSSVQFSYSVVSDSLRPHGPQHTRPPCPSPTPRVYPNSCPLSWWCLPTISPSKEDGTNKPPPTERIWERSKWDATCPTTSFSLASLLAEQWMCHQEGPKIRMTGQRQPGN